MGFDALLMVNSRLGGTRTAPVQVNIVGLQNTAKTALLLLVACSSLLGMLPHVKTTTAHTACGQPCVCGTPALPALQ